MPDTPFPYYFLAHPADVRRTGPGAAELVYGARFVMLRTGADDRQAVAVFTGPDTALAFAGDTAGIDPPVPVPVRTPREMLAVLDALPGLATWVAVDPARGEDVKALVWELADFRRGIAAGAPPDAEILLAPARIIG